MFLSKNTVTTILEVMNATSSDFTRPQLMHIEALAIGSDKVALRATNGTIAIERVLIDDDFNKTVENKKYISNENAKLIKAILTSNKRSSFVDLGNINLFSKTEISFPSEAFDNLFKEAEKKENKTQISFDVNLIDKLAKSAGIKRQINLDISSEKEPIIIKSENSKMLLMPMNRK